MVNIDYCSIYIKCKHPINNPKKRSFPNRNIIFNELSPSNRLGVEKIETGLERLPEIVAWIFDKQLILEILLGNSRRKRSFVLLRRNLNKHSLFAGYLGKGFHNILRSVILGGS
jgi:hypothetical protein